MEDYLCDLLHFHLCSCEIENIDCDDCPFNVLIHSTLDGSYYLEEVKNRINDALALLKG